MKTLAGEGCGSRTGRGKKDGGGIRKNMKMAKKQEGTGKDLGMCLFEIFQGDKDRAPNDQEHIVAIQEVTSRCRAALLNLTEGLPKSNPPSSCGNSVDKGADCALWESLIPERTTLDERKKLTNSKVVRDGSTRVTLACSTAWLRSALEAGYKRRPRKNGLPFQSNVFTKMWKNWKILEKYHLRGQGPGKLCHHLHPKAWRTKRGET